RRPAPHPASTTCGGLDRLAYAGVEATAIRRDEVPLLIRLASPSRLQERRAPLGAVDAIDFDRRTKVDRSQRPGPARHEKDEALGDPQRLAVARVDPDDQLVVAPAEARSKVHAGVDL